MLTDSFHAVAFATLFHKPFLAYERQYVHSQKQSTRLTDFLAEVGLENRFEGELNLGEDISFELADKYFDEKRREADKFLTSIIGEHTVSVTKLRKVQQYDSECCGCGACKDACAHHAITMQPDSVGAYYPVINSEKCIDCGLCRKVCSFKPISGNIAKKQSYIAASKESELIKHSASGGIFAQIAKQVLDEGGVVYGAALSVKDGIIDCKHIRVDAHSELWRIQGSKYVQSSTLGIFPEIKQELKQGKTVLFGGTSCQVAALKGYLRKDYDNLITTDLICHGVPPVQLLQEYADMLKEAFKEEIEDIKFRVRKSDVQPYQLTLTTKSKRGESKKHSIGLRESAYYRLFMSRAGYRPSCYSCPFASIHKPADITLGDYYPTDQDRATRWFALFDSTDMLSSVIIHTEKGQRIFDDLEDLFLKQNLPIDEMTEAHEQLKWPSMMTRAGDNLYALYREGGMNAVQDAIDKRNRLLIFSPLIKQLKSKISRLHEKGEDVSARDENLSG